MLPLRFAPSDRPRSPFSTEAHSIAEMEKKITAPWTLVPDGRIPADEGLLSRETWVAMQHWAAMSYFHPTARSFLFGSKTVRGDDACNQTGNDYLRVYRRSDVRALTVQTSGWHKASIRFSVVRCDLSLFQPDVAVLQLELVADVSGGPISLAAVQTARDQLRRLYPPYFDGSFSWKGGHFPLSVALEFAVAEPPATYKFDSESHIEQLLGTALETPPISLLPKDIEHLPIAAHWAALLHPLNIDDWIPPGDDRLPSLAFLGVDDVHRIPEGDWHRITFADPHGTDELPYARQFMSDRFGQFTYDRFWHNSGDSTDSPSRILNCGYAFTVVGNDNDTNFFANPQNGMMASFRQIYARLGLVAHFQKTALLGASARLSYLAERGKNGELKEYDDSVRSAEIRQFYSHFLEFTQVYWFDEISPQEQGVELFAMWQRSLRTKELYDEVRQELRDLVEFVNVEEQKKQTLAQRRFARTAAVVGGLGVVAGLLGMNILPFEAGKFSPEKFSSEASFAFTLGFLGFTFVLGLVAFAWPVSVFHFLSSFLHSKRNHDDKNSEYRVNPKD